MTEYGGASSTCTAFDYSQLNGSAFNLSQLITIDPYIDIRAFGAIPDDGIDDSAAIQEIIDSANTDYTIYLPLCWKKFQGKRYIRRNKISFILYLKQIKEVANKGFKKDGVTSAHC